MQAAMDTSGAPALDFGLLGTLSSLGAAACAAGLAVIVTVVSKALRR